MHRTHFGGALVASLMVVLLPGCSRAERLDATPSTLAAKLKAARPGDTIKLTPGEYANFVIDDRRYSPNLTIDAGDARITAARISRSEGVTIRGGAFQLGPPRVNPKNGKDAFGAAIRMTDVSDMKIVGARFIGPAAVQGPQRREFGEGYGLRVVRGNKVEVADSQFEGLKTGVAMTQIDGFRLSGNVFSAMRMDGLVVSRSRNGVIEKNECRATRVRENEHPDCIQMWSRPTEPPVSDVIIRLNRIEGATQGIGLHNSVRDGVDDGGFDRITIENNVIRVSRANAISLKNARNSAVRNNQVSTYPGAQFRASIRASGPSVTQCGNTVEAGAGKSGMKDKAC